MNITLIVAMDHNRGIGFQNTIPWMGKIPSDMRHFRETTTGHPVVMGRNTYLSMGKALKNRTNIVLSNSPLFTASDAVVAPSLCEALKHASDAPGRDEVFIIGGTQTYKTALPFADKIIMTIVEDQFETDTHFPEIDMSKWTTESEQRLPTDEKDLFSLHLITLVRKTAP